MPEEEEGGREAAAKPRVRDPITEGKGARERPAVGRQRGPECCLDAEGREKEAEVTLRIHISGGSRKGSRIGGHPSLPHHPLSARSPHQLLPNRVTEVSLSPVASPPGGKGEREKGGDSHFMGTSSPQEAKDVLSSLRTDRVVVKSTADVQGLSADLWAGAKRSKGGGLGSGPGSAGL